MRDWYYTTQIFWDQVYMKLSQKIKHAEYKSKILFSYIYKQICKHYIYSAFILAKPKIKYIYF